MAQPVYLVDFSVYRAPDEYKMSMSKGLPNMRKWPNVSLVGHAHPMPVCVGRHVEMNQQAARPSLG
jgi:hypothetical protein